ncbi:MAG: VanZ family protein [Peptococcaceae bacterium]|jgi:glycopeptide antibiotics resistance protein|nr:VanZ family protein [Peptococcaceae bacterium]
MRYYLALILPIMPLALVIAAAVWFLIHKLRQNHRPQPPRLKMLAEFTLTGWAVMYVYITQFMFGRHAMFHGWYWGRLNLRPLQPFFTALRYGASNAGLFWQMLLNVCMCLPLGFLLPVVFPKRCKNYLSVFLLSLGLALFTELSQLLAGRSADIDDVIANTLGGVLGFWLYIIWRGLYGLTTPGKQAADIKNYHP